MNSILQQLLFIITITVVEAIVLSKTHLEIRNNGHVIAKTLLQLFIMRTDEMTILIELQTFPYKRMLLLCAKAMRSQHSIILSGLRVMMNIIFPTDKHTIVQERIK